MWVVGLDGDVCWWASETGSYWQLLSQSHPRRRTYKEYSYSRSCNPQSIIMPVLAALKGTKLLVDDSLWL